jgi:hypothetical protein
MEISDIEEMRQTESAAAEKLRLKEKKAEYQRTYLAKKKRQKQEEILLNDQGEPLSLDMIYPPSKEQLADAERNPEAALMNLVTNTGLARFRDTSRIIDNWSVVHDAQEIIPDYVEHINQELQSNIENQEFKRILKDFLNDWNIEAELFACASCGVKAFEMGSCHRHHVPLQQLDSLLMSEEEIETLEKIPEEYR